MQGDHQIVPYQFTLEHAIGEWLREKRKLSDSAKTEAAYRETLISFSDLLSEAGLEVLGNPIDVARVASIWAGQRKPQARREGAVSASTYNTRLAILSSFYAFLIEVYHLDIVNPIVGIEKRKVQAYAAAQPIEQEDFAQALESIDRSTLEGKRAYAILAVAVTTGRRASEIVSLRREHLKIARSGLVTLNFEHCKGAKQKFDVLSAEVSAILLDYLHAAYGARLAGLPKTAPVWLSKSRRNQDAPISYHTLVRICRSVLKTGQTHALRHTFTVEMEAAGASLTEISHRLGHDHIETTMIYARQVRSAKNPYAGKVASQLGIKR